MLRIRHKDFNRLVDLATHVLEVWRGYTDEKAFIYAETNGEPHNTITPIARKVGDTYELDLTLRNNITTEEHPLGVYHPQMCIRDRPDTLCKWQHGGIYCGGQLICER